MATERELYEAERLSPERSYASDHSFEEWREQRGAQEAAEEPSYREQEIRDIRYRYNNQDGGKVRYTPYDIGVLLEALDEALRMRQYAPRYPWHPTEFDYRPK